MNYDPSGLIVMSKNDGDILYAGDLKEVLNSVKGQFNGLLGGVNISALVGEKIPYSKLNLAAAILNSDIVSVDITKFTSLRVSQQASPNNTVLVATGVFIKSTGLGVVSCAGGSSGAFPNTSGVGINRIDLLVVNDAGTLSIVSGVEGAVPVAPDYPFDKIPLAEIYIHYNAGGVVIRDADNGTDSYVLKDSRPFLRVTNVPDGSITTAKIADGAVTSAKLASGTLAGRTASESHVAGGLGITYSEKPERVTALATATDHPCGRGAERSGYVYFCGKNANKIVKWNHATGVESAVALAASDAPGDLVRVGTDLYVICNGTFLVKKVDASDVVTTAVNLTTQGAAAGAWTLVNAITKNGDGSVLFTLSKVTGTYVSRLLRVTLSPPGVSHAWDSGAGRYLAMPCFVKTVDGTEYVVVFAHSNPGGTATPSLERRIASDLATGDQVNAGPATQALGAQIPLGCDGQFYYVYDHSTTPDCIRIYDVLAATMYEAGRIELPAVTGAPTAHDTVDLSDSVSGNRYPFFDGYRILFGCHLAAGPLPVLVAVPVPAWGGAFKILLETTANNRINGLATDGVYLFAAVSNGATGGARLVRLLL